MHGQILKTVEAAVSQGGFLTSDTVELLARDETAGNLDCLIRCHETRTIVKLRAVPLAISKLEGRGFTVRDVSFTSDECSRLREHG